MDLAEFSNRVYDDEEKPRFWRRGQYAFNLLAQERPDLSEKIRGDPALDPFHDDKKLPALFLWLECHW